MSLVNPDQRWWRKDRPLRTVTMIVWTVVLLVCVVTGWSNALYMASATWSTIGHTSWTTGTSLSPFMETLAMTLVSVVIFPVIFAAILDGYRLHRRNLSAGWAAAHAVGAVFLGLGTGVLLAALSPLTAQSRPLVLSVGAILVGVGTAVLAIRPLVTYLNQSRGDSQAWSRMHGTPTQAVITDSRVVTTFDVDRWKVTVRFRDGDGNERWHTTTAPVHEADMPTVGTQRTLRYDPDNPGRKSTIFVDLRKKGLGGAWQGR